MKKIILSIAIIISILIFLGIIIIVLTKWKNAKIPIFIHSYENYAWGHESNGYTIYDDGTIEEYDIYKAKEELKVAIITDDELTQLLHLANLVKENYVSDSDPNYWLNPEGSKYRMLRWFDAGITEKKIYNNIDKKWITIYTNGDKMGYNDTEESKKIIEFTHLLNKKYIKYEVD